MFSQFDVAVVLFWEFDQSKIEFCWITSFIFRLWSCCTWSFFIPLLEQVYDWMMSLWCWIGQEYLIEFYTESDPGGVPVGGFGEW